MTLENPETLFYKLSLPMLGHRTAWGCSGATTAAVHIWSRPDEGLLTYIARDTRILCVCVFFLKGVFQEISDALSWGPHRQDPAIIISGELKG